MGNDERFGAVHGGEVASMRLWTSR
jgi:hypothetical protein